jgi:hypothetical protein
MVYLGFTYNFCFQNLRERHESVDASHVVPKDWASSAKKFRFGKSRKIEKPDTVEGFFGPWPGFKVSQLARPKKHAFGYLPHQPLQVVISFDVDQYAAPPGVNAKNVLGVFAGHAAQFLVKGSISNAPSAITLALKPFLPFSRD